MPAMPPPTPLRPLRSDSHRAAWLVFGLIFASTTTATVTAAGDTAWSDDDWATVLEGFVDDRGLVDYAGLAADRAALDRYVAAIEVTSPRSHPERFAAPGAALAYYLNAYNGLVFAGVLDKGPDIASVWGKSRSGLGFFVRRKVTVGGERISLKKYEDAWVREGFHDPRIHAALNCASIGCPRLPRVPFTADALDHELDAAVRELVDDPRHVRLDEATGTVHLSKIFDWFRGDFLDHERTKGTAEPTLVDYVNRYRSSDAQLPRDATVRFLDYDKGLNRQP